MSPPDLLEGGADPDDDLPALCLACGRPPASCPGASIHITCQVCGLPLATGAVGYPGVPGAAPAEVWTPLGTQAPIADDEGHPLTWGRVFSAHASLVAHASCASSAHGYDSDGAEADAPSQCPCQWHPALIEELASHRDAVDRWPGPICGLCWAASCRCGYVFDDAADAAGRDSDGRLVCNSTACRPRVVGPPPLA